MLETRITSTLAAAIAADQAMEQKWQDQAHLSIARKMRIEVGSPFARTLYQYRGILTHNGAPDPLAYAYRNLRSDLTIVDAGCSGGVALTDLRRRFPLAQLHGLDILPANLFTLIDFQSQFQAGELFRETNIQFHQASNLNICKVIPQGYDIVLSVKGFYELATGEELQIYALSQILAGLRKRGLIQIFVNTSKEGLKSIFGSLRKARVSHSWHQADPDFLKANSLDIKGINGILTVGPK